MQMGRKAQAEAVGGAGSGPDTRQDKPEAEAYVFFQKDAHGGYTYSLCLSK